MPGDQLVHNFTVSLPANADLSASLFCGVDLVNSSGKARVAVSGAGGRSIGTLLSKPTAAGEGCAVCTYGAITWGRFGAAVTAADNLKMDATGRYVTAAAADVALGAVTAIALESGAADENHPILLMPIGAQAAGAGSNEIVAANGALSLAARTTYLQVDATKTYTLAAGLFDGQRKTIRAITATNTPAGTVTGAFDTDGTATGNALFNALADQLELEWDTAISKWRVLSNVSVTMS